MTYIETHPCVHVVYFKYAVTWELRLNYKDWRITCTSRSRIFYMNGSYFFRNIKKRKVMLDRMRSEDVVVLANENQPVIKFSPTPSLGIGVERNYCWDSVCFQKDELLVKHNWQSESVSALSAADWITLLLSPGCTPAYVFTLHHTMDKQRNRLDFCVLLSHPNIKLLKLLDCSTSQNSASLICLCWIPIKKWSVYPAYTVLSRALHEREVQANVTFYSCIAQYTFSQYLVPE